MGSLNVRFLTHLGHLPLAHWLFFVLASAPFEPSILSGIVPYHPPRPLPRLPVTERRYRAPAFWMESAHAPLPIYCGFRRDAPRRDRRVLIDDAKAKAHAVQVIQELKHNNPGRFLGWRLRVTEEQREVALIKFDNQT